jgi:transcriptional regulator with XRE-family HTH domain
MSIQIIGNSIKSRRKSLGVTQPSLASLAGVSTNTLYRIERGLANPSVETLQKIATILGLEVGLKIKTIEV